MATAYYEDDAEVIEPVVSPLETLLQIANSQGDLSGLLDESTLTKLGSDVVEDYERDLSNRSEWQTVVESALKKASQEGERPAKNYPFDGAADMNYPIITIAATEFNARSYPAIVKGDETILVKVVGSDKGKPVVGPDGMPQVQWKVGPDGMMAKDEEGLPIPELENGKPKIEWQVPPGAKTARASRVKEFLNVVLNYRMKGWESDTDTLLYQLSIVGCGFRKCWWDGRKSIPGAGYVPALRLVVPMDAKDLATAPRYTEELPDVYPYQIRRRMRSGEYREVTLTPDSDDAEAPRMLLEQHRLHDLDGDGFDEPYIVTVDKETSQVLSIVAAFGPDDLVVDDEVLVDINRQEFYVHYEFLPHPEGKFYGIGLGHLLKELGGLIDTTINQMIDAGHAQIAGGGFMASGLRMQSNGQNNKLRFRPGEYKVVTAAGGLLRDAIYERTFPGASPVMFQLLDLILGAARDVAAIKDVTSGDASNNGQVGTTLALIEQGLQVFTAIYKRVYRALRCEFQLMFDNIGKYGSEATAKMYLETLDDDKADFAKDFDSKDFDIRPVSDPNSVTRLQKMARAQFLLQTGQGNPIIDQQELMRRAYEAADVEDIDKLFVPAPDPEAPPPPEAQKLMSETERNAAQAKLYIAQAEAIPAKVAADDAKTAADVENKNADTAKKGAEFGKMIGEAEAGPDDDTEGRVSDVD